MRMDTKNTKLLTAEPYFIWVLAPQLETDDPVEAFTESSIVSKKIVGVDPVPF